MTNLRDWQKKASERSYEKAEAARIQCPCCGETFSNDATIEMSRDCHRDAEIDLLLQIIEKQSEALEWIKNPEHFHQSCIPVIDETLAEVQGLVEKLVGEK